MFCPYCNNELFYVDSYGSSSDLSSGNPIGQIYKCYNSEGYNSIDEILEYLVFTNRTMKSLGLKNLEDVVCDSAMHHVTGYFYTDISGNLHNGYPC